MGRADQMGFEERIVRFFMQAKWPNTTLGVMQYYRMPTDARTRYTFQRAMSRLRDKGKLEQHGFYKGQRLYTLKKA